ncbi:hypothetical protein BKP35_06045 [Anaerobacillus arseniciselenatis]|uniref:Major facilitator superfamily (MFS) profile domain-containing protein n=1 Tax=Anaerobacillus arseniciselenatis TaxID=85682 RepID=A0A1S2LQ14_9BACI|nr:MFS transporter [Anaerobacillus arseniciselenatis]OIJ14608.1 hypothetical protein BKP35_06045 [Anaerobacillus arseniciselenatis]
MEQSQTVKIAQTYSIHHILTLFALLALLIVSNLYIMIPLLENVSDTYTISTSEASLSISVFSFFYACGLIFFGTLSERFGLKETICSGLAMLIILMLACFFINSFLLFIILRGIQGFWAASFAPVSFIYVLNVLEEKHQTITIAVINTGFLSAGVFGQLLSSTVNIVFSWQAIFATLALLYFVLLIYAIKKLPRPSKSNHPKSIGNIIKVLAKLPFQPRLKRFYFITFTILLSFVAYYTALESYFTHELQLSATNALMIRGFGLVGLLLTIFFEKITNRIGYVNAVIAGLTLQLIGLACSVSQNIYVITLGSMIFVAGVAIVIPAIIQLIGKNGAGQRTYAISLYSFILLLGASVGSTIILIPNYFLKLTVLAALLSFSLLAAFREK